jgi:hypothetical protein
VGLPSAKQVKISAALSIFFNPIAVVEVVVVEMPAERGSEDGEGGETVAVVTVIVDVDDDDEAAAPDKGADDERWRFLNRSNTLAREVLFGVVT